MWLASEYFHDSTLNQLLQVQVLSYHSKLKALLDKSPHWEQAIRSRPAANKRLRSVIIAPIPANPSPGLCRDFVWLETHGTHRDIATIRQRQAIVQLIIDLANRYPWLNIPTRHLDIYQ